MRPKRLSLATALAALALAGAALAEPPKGWVMAGSEPQRYETGVEARGAAKVAFIRGKPGEATTKGFGTLMQMADAAPYLGKRVRLSAVLKADGAERAQMWMRVDGRERPVAFDNMQDRPLTGTTDWKRYEIVLDVPEGSRAVAYGFFLSGAGKVSADDFRLEVVDPKTPLTGRSMAPRNLSFEESAVAGAAALG